MSFDVGKWFDEKEEQQYGLTRKAVVQGLRVSFGEQCLKEWFEHFYPIQLEIEDNLKPFLKFFKEDYKKPWKGTLDYATVAVSCLGESRCLVLLKKMWEAKK